MPTMTKDEIRKLYPMVLYEESHWEVYDEVEGRIVAHFFEEKEALAYLEWRNSVSEDLIENTLFNEEVAEQDSDESGAGDD